MATQERNFTFCTDVTTAAGEDPAGSAWALRRMMLIQFPLPWAYNSLESRNVPEGLGDLLMELWNALDEPWGMIGIAPDPAYCVEGKSWIFDLDQGDALAGSYHRTGYLVPNDEVVRYLRLLSFEPNHPDVIAARQPDDQLTRDFLICTHGAVDACCATMGYPVYQLMRAMADHAETPTRVWRCTHFGGHRFAATALEAPSGRYWGRLEAGMLANLVHRRVPLNEMRPYYRGWAALAQPLWQVAEAEILAQCSWSWFDAQVTAIDGDATLETGGTLTLAFTHPSAGSGEIDIELTPTGTVTMLGSCRGAEPTESPQFETRISAMRPENVLQRLTP